MPDPVLMTMPLHAITEVYGHAGLRERFLLEIEELPEPTRARLTEALELAEDLHADDRRVREPYANHLLRVAIRIKRYYGIEDPDVLVAALLHDAVEDHPAELAALGATGADAGTGARAVPQDPAREATEATEATEAALAVLAERFGRRVADLVAAVTNPVYDPDRDEHEQYREHVAASLDRNPWARVIKASDFTDNGVGVIHTTGPKVNSSATKYRPLVPVLRELIARPDTPLSDEARRHIFDQFDLAERRFAAILHD
jgi:HD domain